MGWEGREGREGVTVRVEAHSLLEVFVVLRRLNTVIFP